MIERAGYDADYQRVETAETFRHAPVAGTWDLVLSDHSMPGFSAIAALQLLHEHDLDLPLIIMCGEAGEEVAIARAVTERERSARLYRRATGGEHGLTMTGGVGDGSPKRATDANGLEDGRSFGQRHESASAVR